MPLRAASITPTWHPPAPAIVATNHTCQPVLLLAQPVHLVSRTTKTIVTPYLLYVRTIDTYFPRAIAPLVTVSVLFVAEYEYRTFSLSYLDALCSESTYNYRVPFAVRHKDEERGMYYARPW